MSRSIFGALCLALAACPARAADTIYIPENPRAAEYLLRGFSDQKLTQAPRVEPVFNAWLSRPSLDAKYREDALKALAELHKTDRLAELLAALARLDEKGEDAAPARHKLGELLVRTKPDELTAKRAAIVGLLGKAQQSDTRSIAYAALVTADGKVDKIWEEASKENTRLADLLAAVPLLSDQQLRNQFFPRLGAFLKKDSDAELRRRAIQALPLMKGQEAANFATLAQLIREGTARPAAVSAMLQLARQFWQKESAGPVAQSLVDYAGKVPVDARTSAEYLEATQLAKDLSMLLPAEDGKRIRKTIGDLGVTVIVIKTLREQMLYDRTRLVVEAGKPVEIILENNDAMPHNLVITAPGAREEIGKAAETMPPTPDAQGRPYIPNSPKLLFATKLVQPGERAPLSFTAPATPGDYDYVCTFPGHWLRMFGTMVVVKDVEEYLAKNPQPEEQKFTEWTLEDFSGDWEKYSAGRNFATGKKLFTSVGCVQCHQLGVEGADFGAPLPGVFKKYNNDHKLLLEQILDPSSRIDDKYHPVTIETAEGDTVTGLVVTEEAQSISVQPGPSAASIQKIEKGQIKSRRQGQLSLMPAGLLNILTKEQILDLLAYVESEGNADHTLFLHKH